MNKPIQIISPAHPSTIKPQRAYPDEIWLFEYHCWESEESCDAELWHHTKQLATILYRLPPKDVDEYDVGIMYQIQFDDGFEYSIFDDELIRKATGIDQ